MKNLYAFVFVFILIIGFTSANFLKGNETSFLSKTSYGPNDLIEGWINLSLDNANSSLVLRDNMGNSISLQDWLKVSSIFNVDFFCNPVDCSLAYQKVNQKNSLNYNLNNNQEVLAGIYLEGNLLSIDSLSFSFFSDSNESCFTPYKVNFLNSENDFYAVGIGDYCNSFKTYGCFNPFSQLEEYKMIGFPYCQKITLPSSPGYALGAWLKAETGKDYDMTFQLYNMYGEAIEGASCKLPEFNVSGEEVFCDVNVSFSKTDDYYLCLKSKNLNYPFIQVDDSNSCGFINQHSDFYSDLDSSYRFFVIPRKFLSSGEVLFNRSLSKNQDLSSLATAYLSSVYGSLDCSKGCILPFSIISNSQQNVLLNNLNLEYVVSGRGSLTQNRFSEIVSTPPFLNTNNRYRTFSLNNLNFSVKGDYGNFTYKMYLGEDILFEKLIYIEKIPLIKQIFPIRTFSNYPTEFNLRVETFENSTIKSYEWDFGDGTVKTTQTNKITHAYNSTGKYNLKVTVTDTLNRPASRIFEIEVGSAREIINTTLVELKSNLISSTNYINSLSAYHKKVLNSNLDIDELNAQLIQLEREFGQAYTQEEYNRILNSLLSLEIPKSISISSQIIEGPFFPLKQSINLDVIAEVTSSKFDSLKSNELKDIILYWNNENIEILLSGSVYDIDFGSGSYPYIMVLELKTRELNTLQSSPYLFIKKLEGLKFDEKTPQEAFGYYYFNLQSSQNSFNFYSKEIAFPEIPLYASTSFSVLNQYLGKAIFEFEEEKGEFSYFALVFSIILAILVGIFIYFFLSSWYKNKYENHLFKNQNNLYNLISYIENAKQRGESEEKIFSNLRKSGWSSEQISYVSKKHKNIGDGIFSFFSKKVLEKNSSKKRGNNTQNFLNINNKKFFNQRKPFK